jgi:hypothetical protein
MLKHRISKPLKRKKNISAVFSGFGLWGDLEDFVPWIQENFTFVVSCSRRN